MSESLCMGSLLIYKSVNFPVGNSDVAESWTEACRSVFLIWVNSIIR